MEGKRNNYLLKLEWKIRN